MSSYRVFRSDYLWTPFGSSGSPQPPQPPPSFWLEILVVALLFGMLLKNFLDI